MAFGIKQWLALVGILLLAVAAWGLTPPPTPQPREREILPERQRFLELQGDLFLEGWLFKRLQWRDSLVMELQRGVSEGRSVVLGLPPNVPDSVRDRLSEAVDFQFLDLELETPAMPLGVFVFPESQGAHPLATGVSRGLDGNDEYYLARGGEEPFCIVAVPYYDQTDPAEEGRTGSTLARRVRAFAELPANRQAHSNTLGLCRYFVKYGQPGPEMMSWLRDGASGLGTRVFELDHHHLYGKGPARGPFGKPRPRLGHLPPGTLRCLAGSREDCGIAVLNPVVLPSNVGLMELDIPALLAGSPVDFREGLSTVAPDLLGLGPYFLFATEEELGAERFGEFWRSPLDPAEAFQAAFDEPMDLWAMRWLRRFLDPVREGPSVPVNSTLFTFLTLGVLVGGAVRIGRR